MHTAIAGKGTDTYTKINQRGEKEIERKKKTINNEQALNGIYFRDGYHAKVLVS